MDNKNTIPPNTLSKAEKLKSRKAIDGLFKNGKSFFIHPYKVFFDVKCRIMDVTPAIDDKISDTFPQTSDTLHHTSNIQVGFAVSTKNFRHAVDRNRVKRLGREAYRLNKHQLISHLDNQQLQLQVFFVFTNKSLPTFTQVQLAMQACLRKLIKTAKNEGVLQG